MRFDRAWAEFTSSATSSYTSRQAECTTRWTLACLVFRRRLRFPSTKPAATTCTQSLPASRRRPRRSLSRGLVGRRRLVNRPAPVYVHKNSGSRVLVNQSNSRSSSNRMSSPMVRSFTGLFSRNRQDTSVRQIHLLNRPASRQLTANVPSIHSRFFHSHSSRPVLFRTSLQFNDSSWPFI
jgi:hypothetical protein